MKLPNSIIKLIIEYISDTQTYKNFRLSNKEINKFLEYIKVFKNNKLKYYFQIRNDYKIIKYIKNKKIYSYKLNSEGKLTYLNTDKKQIIKHTIHIGDNLDAALSNCVIS